MSLDRVPPIPLSRAHVCGRNVCNKWLFFSNFSSGSVFPGLQCIFAQYTKTLKSSKKSIVLGKKRKIFRGQAPTPLTPHQDPDQLRHWCQRDLYAVFDDCASRHYAKPLAGRNKRKRSILSSEYTAESFPLRMHACARAYIHTPPHTDIQRHTRVDTQTYTRTHAVHTLYGDH